MYATMGGAFPQVHAFVLGKQYVGNQSTNVMLVAVNSEQPLSAEEWRVKALEYQSASYDDSYQVRQMVNDLLTTAPAKDEAILFTDDYAPIETMSF